MHNLKFFIVILIPFLCINTAYSQIPKGEMAGVELIKFKSAINNQNYELYIKLPASYNDVTKRYPVMYLLDGQWSFPLTMEIRGGLLADNLIPEIIFVGIAWPDNYFENRNRDFTPTHTSIDSFSGGGQKFLKVIKNEIIKKIDSAYRTDKTNDGLFGASLGGLFVLYTLLQQPSSFNCFMANSPSLWYDNELIFLLEKSFREKNRELNAKLFISSGEYEEEFDPVTFKKFNEQLTVSNYKGLEIEKLVVDKTGHGSAGPYAISRGLQFVFGKPDIMVDTLLLDKYTGHYEQGVIITRTGSSLYIEMMGRKVRMHAATNESFYVNGVNGTSEFTKDNKGKITGYSVKSENKILFFAKKLD